MEKLNHIYKPGMKTYLLLFILSILVFSPFLVLKCLEIKNHKAFFINNDFYKCCILCLVLIFILWLELCATKIILTKDKIIYIQHLVQKKTLHFRNIKSLEFDEGTLIIASKLSGKIEINLNSIKDKDVKILIERLEKEVDSNGG